MMPFLVLSREQQSANMAVTGGRQFLSYVVLLLFCVQYSQEFSDNDMLVKTGVHQFTIDENANLESVHSVQKRSSVKRNLVKRDAGDSTCSTQEQLFLQNLVKVKDMKEDFSHFVRVL